MSANDFNKTPLLQSVVNPLVTSLDKTKASKHLVNIEKSKQTINVAAQTNKILFSNAVNVSQYALVEINILQTANRVPYTLTLDFGNSADGTDAESKYNVNVIDSIYHNDFRVRGDYFNFNITNLSDTNSLDADLQIYFKNYTDYYPQAQIENNIEPGSIAQPIVNGNDYFTDLGARKIGNSKYIKRMGYIDNLVSYPALMWEGGSVQAAINTSNVLSTITATTLTTPSAADDGTITISGYNSFGERENETITMTDGTGVSTGTFTLIDLAYLVNGWTASQDIKLTKTTGGTLANYIPQGDNRTMTAMYQSPASVNCCVIKEFNVRGFCDSINPVISLKWKNVDGNPHQTHTLYKTTCVDNNNVNLSIPINLKVPPRCIVWMEITTGNSITSPLIHVALNGEIVIYEDYNYMPSVPTYNLRNLPIIHQVSVD